MRGEQEEKRSSQVLPDHDMDWDDTPWCGMEWEETETLFPAATSSGEEVCSTLSRGGGVVCSAPTCGGGVLYSTSTCGGGVVCPDLTSGGEVVCPAPSFEGGVVCLATNRRSEEDFRSQQAGTYSSRKPLLPTTTCFLWQPYKNSGLGTVCLLEHSCIHCWLCSLDWPLHQPHSWYRVRPI